MRGEAVYDGHSTAIGGGEVKRPIGLTEIADTLTADLEPCRSLVLFPVPSVNLNAHCLCQQLQRRQRNVSLATLHRSNVCAVQPATMGEFILRYVVAMAKGPDIRC